MTDLDLTINRLGLMTLAVVDMSEGGFVLIRTGARMRRAAGLTRELRVDVRSDGKQHTARSKCPALDDMDGVVAAEAITQALDRAREWLAAKGAGR